MVADQKNSEAYEFIEEISEKGLDLSYQILVFMPRGIKILFIIGRYDKESVMILGQLIFYFAIDALIFILLMRKVMASRDIFHSGCPSDEVGHAGDPGGHDRLYSEAL